MAPKRKQAETVARGRKPAPPQFALPQAPSPSTLTSSEPQQPRRSGRVSAGSISVTVSGRRHNISSGGPASHSDTMAAASDGEEYTIAAPDANVPRDLAKTQPCLTHETKRKRQTTEGDALSTQTDADAPPKRTRTVRAPRAPPPLLPHGGSGEAATVAKGIEDSAEEAQRGAARPPAVNAASLPLPWSGRLGYACLNTYLRSARPSVFCSRTCRISSIIDHRHPLQDATKPEHPTKNRPDKDRPAERELGLRFVQDLGLANVRDLVKMVRWNDKYNIKFMRLSSDMFPFASHAEHGYRLGFAATALAEAGNVAAELGHRLTTHPGQFTQLGSPRREVILAAVRDLEYHDEMLSLLQLPPQQDADAIMIIHMGGTFGDKAATLERFRKNYMTLLSPAIKSRLVLENDDVSWSVHDLLPICEELNIPLVLDFHHHNIVFDATKVREGDQDVAFHTPLGQRIAATWTRKGITQKWHYSEHRAGQVTPNKRRTHSDRVWSMPPCKASGDLMIEAKDKEQAVFEMMRRFRLPGFERIHDMIPHEREDEQRSVITKSKTRNKGQKAGKSRAANENETDDQHAEEDAGVDYKGTLVSQDNFGMGGSLKRVYWPPGCEDWLRPKKREVKNRNTKDKEP